MMVGFWILVVVLIVWAVRASSRTTTEPDRALHTLEDRFARGEIDIEEFDRWRQHRLESRQPRK